MRVGSAGALTGQSAIHKDYLTEDWEYWVETMMIASGEQRALPDQVELILDFLETLRLWNEFLQKVFQFVLVPAWVILKDTGAPQMLDEVMADYVGYPLVSDFVGTNAPRPPNDPL